MKECLRGDGPECQTKLASDLILSLRIECVDYTIDGLGCTVRMQRSQYEVPGFGGGKRGRDGLHVAHFTYHDDVGLLTDNVTQGLGERR